MSNATQVEAIGSVDKFKKQTPSLVSQSSGEQPTNLRGRK